MSTATRAYSCNNHLEAELFGAHYMYESFAYPIKQGGVDGGFQILRILIPFHNTCNEAEARTNLFFFTLNPDKTCVCRTTFGICLGI